MLTMCINTACKWERKYTACKQTSDACDIWNGNVLCASISGTFDDIQRSARYMYKAPRLLEQHFVTNCVCTLQWYLQQYSKGT